MWESRGLCEISKRLWKSFGGFHSRVISMAACVLVTSACEKGGWYTLPPLLIVVPTGSYAVVFQPRGRVRHHEAAARRLRIR